MTKRIFVSYSTLPIHKPVAELLSRFSSEELDWFVSAFTQLENDFSVFLKHKKATARSYVFVYPEIVFTLSHFQKLDKYVLIDFELYPNDSPPPGELMILSFTPDVEDEDLLLFELTAHMTDQHHMRREVFNFSIDLIDATAARATVPVPDAVEMKQLRNQTSISAGHFNSIDELVGSDQIQFKHRNRDLQCNSINFSGNKKEIALKWDHLSIQSDSHFENMMPDHWVTHLSCYFAARENKTTPRTGQAACNDRPLIHDKHLHSGYNIRRDLIENPQGTSGNNSSVAAFFPTMTTGSHCRTRVLTSVAIDNYLARISAVAAISELEMAAPWTA